jgi:hypothetical protein
MGSRWFAIWIVKIGDPFLITKICINGKKLKKKIRLRLIFLKELREKP